MFIYLYSSRVGRDEWYNPPDGVKSETEIYERFHIIMDNIRRHTSSIVIKRIYEYIKLETEEALLKLETEEALQKSGGKRIAPIAPAYKLNGEKVSLLINKKKLHRSVYVKGNGNGKAKYCKINNEFVLLSKLKNKIIE